MKMKCALSVPLALFSGAPFAEDLQGTYEVPFLEHDDSDPLEIQSNTDDEDNYSTQVTLDDLTVETIDTFQMKSSVLNLLL